MVCNICRVRSMPEKKRVMVFGVFDCLHEGHRWFLNMAREYGGELIVAVARDSVVEDLKRRKPAEDQETRRAALEALACVSRAELGDEEKGVYSMLKKHMPNVICLGYDQDALACDLAERMARGEIPAIPLVRLAAYGPERFHSSLTNRPLG